MRSVELFHRVNEQDFAACGRSQPAMADQHLRDSRVLVPSEHHIIKIHDWLQTKLVEDDRVRRVSRGGRSGG